MKKATYVRYTLSMRAILFWASFQYGLTEAGYED